MDILALAYTTLAIVEPFVKPLLKALLYLSYREGVDELIRANKTALNTSEACVPNTPKRKKSRITINPSEQSQVAPAVFPARQGEVV